MSDAPGDTFYKETGANGKNDIEQKKDTSGILDNDTINTVIEKDKDIEESSNDIEILQNEHWSKNMPSNSNNKDDVCDKTYAIKTATIPDYTNPKDSKASCGIQLWSITDATNIVDKEKLYNYIRKGTRTIWKSNDIFSARDISRSQYQLHSCNYNIDECIKQISPFSIDIDITNSNQELSTVSEKLDSNMSSSSIVFHSSSFGYILDKDDISEIQINNKKKDKEKDEKQKEKDKIYKSFPGDNLCFICQDDGIVILCEKCPKVFHPFCVSLEKIPQGLWICKHHICHQCKTKTIEPLFACSTCFVSYCKNHLPIRLYDKLLHFGISEFLCSKCIDADCRRINKLYVRIVLYKYYFNIYIYILYTFPQPQQNDPSKIGKMAFQLRLNSFLNRIGRNQRTTPIIYNKSIDQYTLYAAVITNGGLANVLRRLQLPWKITESLGLTITPQSYTKQIEMLQQLSIVPISQPNTNIITNDDDTLSTIFVVNTTYASHGTYLYTYDSTVLHIITIYFFYLFPYERRFFLSSSPLYTQETEILQHFSTYLNTSEQRFQNALSTFRKNLHNTNTNSTQKYNKSERRSKRNG